MDNCTHTLCGLALARAGGDRLGPLATPTLVVAASLPDCDIVGSLWGGKPWYLLHHRGLTHSLLGLGVESVLLAGVMWAIGRAVRLRERPRFGRLWVAASLGLISHLLLDGLNTYGIRPWLPFSEARYFGDAAFIVDPWLWLAFGSAACLGAPGPRDPRGTAGWFVFAALALMFFLGSHWLPARAALVWVPAFLVVLALRVRGVGAESSRRRIAWAGIGCGLLYLAGLVSADRVAAERALEAVRAAQPDPVEVVVCHPVAATPWRFKAVVATRRQAYQVDVDLARDRADLAPTVARGLDEPGLSRVRGTFPHRAWRSFARVPFVARTRNGVLLGDARYTPVPRPTWCNLLVPFPPRLARDER